MGALNKILVLITGSPPPAVASSHGDYGTMMARAFGPAWPGGYQMLDVRAGPPAAATPAAVVITGSSASVPDRAPWMLATERWIRQAVAAGTPVLGVCFGHQLLAQALGGRVTTNPAGREIGTVRAERLTPDPLFDGLAAHFEIHACHSDAVVALPPGTTVLATSARDPHLCVRFADRCYGVQFHPEIDAAVMRLFIDARAGAMRSEGLDPVACRQRVRDAPAGGRLMSNFATLIARA